MPSPKPEERKRRFRPRSRNGCITCKAKHIRCDERKPLCTNCLVKGGKCGYTDPSSKLIDQFQTTCGDSALWPHRRALSLADCTPNHPFVGYPVEMTHDSRFLFNIFFQNRSIVNEDTAQPVQSFVIHRALSSPALLHFALLLSSIKWTWDTGSMQRIRKSYLHHKLEAIKFVNEQLQDPKTAFADSTIASIVGLALAESALGNRDTATAHMKGLAQVVGMRDAQNVTGGNIFQSLVILTSKGAGKMPIQDLLNVIGGVEDHQSLSLCMCRIIGDKFTGGAEARATMTIQDVLEDSERGRVRGELSSSVPSTICESRGRLMSSYLLVFGILGTDNIDPFIVNWLVEWMLSDLCVDEEAVRRGKFPRQLWFWGAMKSICAVTSARATSDLEAGQIDKWRVLCQEKIRLVSRTLNLMTWEQVKEVFMTWVWRDNFDQEHQLREMWEEAIFGKCFPMVPIAAPSYLDRHDFMSVEERARSIRMTQIRYSMKM